MADSRRISTTPPTSTHHVDVTYVAAKCGSPGHRDLVITCSCGFESTKSHGTPTEAGKTIFYHRLEAVEALLGMKVEIEWHT